MEPFDEDDRIRQSINQNQDISANEYRRTGCSFSDVYQ